MNKENNTWHGQRDIKFRAFVTDTKEMIYSSDKQKNYTFSMYLSEWLVLEKFDKSIPRWKVYIHSTIMQYTWLYDKNGVEIYVGDIVQSLDAMGDMYWFNNKWNRHIVWDCWIWEIERLDCWLWYISWQVHNWLKELIDNWHEIEIIWNIYQNPELLSE